MLGFSLIELVVTLAILGLLASMLAPGFGGVIERYSMDSTANKVVAALNYAKTKALAKAEIVGICASYTGTDCANDPDAWGSQAIVYSGRDPNDNTKRIGTLSIGKTESVSVKSNMDTLYFTASGTLDLKDATLCGGHPFECEVRICSSDNETSCSTTTDADILISLTLAGQINTTRAEEE